MGGCSGVRQPFFTRSLTQRADTFHFYLRERRSDWKPSPTRAVGHTNGVRSLYARLPGAPKRTVPPKSDDQSHGKLMSLNLERAPVCVSGPSRSRARERVSHTYTHRYTLTRAPCDTRAGSVLGGRSSIGNRPAESSLLEAPPREDEMRSFRKCPAALHARQGTRARAHTPTHRHTTHTFSLLHTRTCTAHAHTSSQIHRTRTHHTHTRRTYTRTHVRALHAHIRAHVHARAHKCEGLQFRKDPEGERSGPSQATGEVG